MCTSLWTIKLHEILLSYFKGAAMKNFFSCVFNFVQKGHKSLEKIEAEFPAKLQIYTASL